MRIFKGVEKMKTFGTQNKNLLGVSWAYLLRSDYNLNKHR